MITRTASALLFACALTACPAGPPTYHRDVAPILEKHCVSCHQPQGPVPQLTDYAHARTYAQTIALSTKMRNMPPWGADNTGLCGTWQGARWMSPAEIATLAKWQESGAAEGDPRAHKNASLVPAPLTARADAVLDTGGDYAPGIGAGGYHCFVADPKLTEDRFLTAMRLIAPDARGIAQVTLFALDSEAADRAALLLDAADATLGYSCYGTPRTSDARLVASWTRGDPVLRFPAGTGVRVRAGRKIVVQIHYDIIVPGLAYRTWAKVGLELEARAREAEVMTVAAGSGALPLNQRYLEVTQRRAIDRPLRIVGIAPRMHTNGRLLQLSRERAGTSTCIGDFDHWNFYRAQLFFPDHPPELAPGDSLAIKCVYSTAARTRPIVFGDGVEDEECIAYVMATRE